jgi:hypothetical protein
VRSDAAEKSDGLGQLTARDAADIRVVDLHATRERRVESGECSQQGGLARRVGADDHRDAPGSEREVEVVDDTSGGVAGGEGTRGEAGAPETTSSLASFRCGEQPEQEGADRTGHDADGHADARDGVLGDEIGGRQQNCAQRSAGADPDGAVPQEPAGDGGSAAR